MGLILCSEIEAKKPYYIEELSVNIYSIEELCYVIYEHPLLVLDNFISQGLIEFIKVDLGMSILGAQLEKMSQERHAEDVMLIYILEFTEIYKTSEINRYKSELNNFRKLKKADFLKEKADYMFKLRRYGRAIRYYKAVIKISDEKNVKDKLLAKTYHNVASAFANLFMFDKAYEYYVQAYNILGDKHILKRLYLLSYLDKRDELKLEYIESMGSDIMQYWDEEFNQTVRKVKQAIDKEEIDNIFKKDPIKLRKLLIEEISKFKVDYRNMI